MDLVQLEKIARKSLIVRLDTYLTVPMKIAVRKVGLVMAYVMVWINHGDAISPAMTAMVVIVMQLLVLHVKMMD
jgi:hypothetical protein